MTLTINGEQRRFEREMTLAQLLEALGMKADRVAVELNRQIAQRSRWSETALHDGDQLEIVHFVGGGAGFAPASARQPLLNRALAGGSHRGAMLLAQRLLAIAVGKRRSGFVGYFAHAFAQDKHVRLH